MFGRSDGKVVLS